MRTALVLSPHLDDAAFSCGGTMAVLVDAGWRVVMATVFTRSVHPAAGFALACQLDKGLGAGVDYMALRRGEDLEAGRALGAEVRWLDLEEAPHRGYESAPALFGGVREGDEAWRAVAPLVAGLVADVQPEVVLAPQGLGGHVDHRQVILALREASVNSALAYYRDTPYAMRDDKALPFVTMDGLRPARVSIEAGLERKLSAACAYGSQVGFQFGGAAAAAQALRAFAMREGCGTAGERFLVDAGESGPWAQLPQFERR